MCGALDAMKWLFRIDGGVVWFGVLCYGVVWWLVATPKLVWTHGNKAVL